QITVPKELRDALGWKAGDRVAFRGEADGIKIVFDHAKPTGKEIVDRLKKAKWRKGLSTKALMDMTRGET
ncbi:MAG: AbrB/MazE/SpoVT family DNA-binding domain-containing protein, partial [Acidobacteriota bacterium]